MRRSAGRASPDAPVAVGRLPGGDLARAGTEQLAAPVSLGDLRLLVLRDDTLHLGQQHGLRVVCGQVGGVGETHLDAEAGQLVKDQHLVGVGAGQAVGGQAPHHLEQASLGGVAQAVQPGAVKTPAGVPVVDVLGDQLITGGGDMLTKQGQLRTDRAALGLPFGRHASVERSPHRAPPVSTLDSAGSAAAASSRNW